ncbi:hypothetical protein VW29_18570 [Devosia limi DSM 17137]|uniref:Fluoride-specific ion channel FluC n=1 Tax=Devosia limi DSM 17137 TaxID=1121477 RepID=A0A0F5L561_9HYPH|nr:fluoride efflux transporter CrcB [Devosia limi]KKB77365.1 hypothetical protein VW29_18570 [Devosia limi DSM 17137]SHE67744.1 CrcB protein [Devosia limi DSM 17137]
MQGYILVGIGGALGAMSRYGLSHLVSRFWTASFPLATLLINVLGAVCMGLFIGVMARTLPAWGNEARLFVAVGILGGFTTFSTFSLDAVVLIERGDVAQAVLYALLSVVVCLCGLYLGLLMTRGSPI